MSFTTAKKARDIAGGFNAPGVSFTDPYQLLAINIIIRILKDLKHTRDRYKIAALLKWFDTPWGITICDFIGIEAEYMREVMRNEAAKKHIRNDCKRIKKVYQETDKKSKHTLEKHRKA